MITETKTTRVDIRQGAAHMVLRAPLATLDNRAHVFEAQVYDGDAAADLSGAKCEAYFIRADGVTVTLDGTVSGSTASVTLGANCYAVPGRFELAVKLTQGDTVHTVLRAEGSVTTSRTDAMTGAGTGAQSFDQLIQAVNGAAAGISKRDRVWNLLDNSNFLDPVNQRGASSYTSNGHTIDRWRDTTNSTTLITENGLTLQNNSTTSNAYWRQRLPAKVLTSGKTYTMALNIDGVVYCGHTMISSDTSPAFYGANGLYLSCGGLANNTYWTIQIALSAGRTFAGVRWAALYEGEYTAETLPAYVPKGYTAELLECQRYYYNIPDSADIAYVGFSASDTLARITITTPVPMIARPNLSVADLTKLNLYDNGNAGKVTAVHCADMVGNSVALYCTASSLTAWKPCVMRFNTPAALSAEL